MTLPWRFELERRLEISRKIAWGVPALSVLLAFIFGALILVLAGASPIETYRAMLAGAFGSISEWTDGNFLQVTETLVRATPLIFTGLAVAMAFRMLFWNIGTEGQLVMGAIAAAWVALFLPDLLPWLPQTRWIYIPIGIVAAMFAGALWAFIPAMMKVKLGVNEIISTLMFNYIAILLYQQLYTGSWKDPEGFGFPGTALFPEFSWFPKFSEIPILNVLSGRIHLGFPLAIVVAVVLWVIMDKTKRGYEVRLLGENVGAAEYAGISVFKNVLFVMVLSGGVAGLAGLSQVAGLGHRLQAGLAVGNGFTGIIIAWLAKLRPLSVVIVAVMMAALFVGGDQLQISLGLPSSIAAVLQGAILIFVLSGDVFTRYRLKVTRVARHAGAVGEEV
ncbi:MAG: ABC transporter permease [Acidobacteria bacterium]|nr:ABC transporter permease [Acidobacteriota bacterium]